MKKFLVILNKEIRELVTPQLLLPVVVMMGIFSLLGGVLSEEGEKQKETATQIVIEDKDKSTLSSTVLDSLKAAGFEFVDKVETSNTTVSYTIPKGFEKNIESGVPGKVEVFTSLKNLSILGSAEAQKSDIITQTINSITSNSIISKKTKITDSEFLRTPVLADHHLEINGKKADISPQAIISYTTSQTTFIPIVLFLVITIAAQLVAIAIASEKENKTLETLLSLPINRNLIVIAKLLGAALVSAIFALFYMIGMRSYMNGIIGSTTSEMSIVVSKAVETLGLSFSTPDYILLGVSLFMGILVALTMSFILGSFAKDTKSAQGVTTPVMVMLLIPYLLSMTTDINSLSAPLQLLLKVIPFTHTFTAAPNIMLNNYTNVYIGIGYMLILVIIGVILATKLFNSEKIFTLNLDFLKKK